MLRSYRKTIWGIHVVNPEEEKERLRWEEFAEKEVFVFLSLTNHQQQRDTFAVVIIVINFYYHTRPQVALQ